MMTTIFKIWTNFLVFFVGISLTPGIRILDGLQGYLITGLIYSVLIYFIPRVIEFFKINVNIWSYILIGGIVSTLYFYIMRYVFLGFMEFSTVGPSVNIFGLKQLNGFDFSENEVILFAGIFLISLATVNQWLIDKS